MGFGVLAVVGVLALVGVVEPVEKLELELNHPRRESLINAVPLVLGGSVDDLMPSRKRVAISRPVRFLEGVNVVDLPENIEPVAFRWSLQHLDDLIFGKLIFGYGVTNIREVRERDGLGIGGIENGKRKLFGKRVRGQYYQTALRTRICRSLSAIYLLETEVNGLIWVQPLQLGGLDRQVGSKLSPGRFANVLQGGLGSIGGTFGLAQSQGDQDNASPGDGCLGNASIEQEHRPERGVLRGLGGVAGVLLACGGLGVVVLCFKRCGDALSVAMERGGWAWSRLLVWFPAALGICWLVAGIAVYWAKQSQP